MEAKKQLRKPENWEDFESLCKKLWGEIWQCPEIKKNGRKGQKQKGVDIYGVPKDEKGYYGIQCKGKDDYTQKQLTKDEIDTEIQKAEFFSPPLIKFYFATTANKNADIEEYVREVDLDHRRVGLFEIHLYSWEDIVDLIDENKEAHDWYLKNQRYKNLTDIEIVFENGEKELKRSVTFKDHYTHYELEKQQAKSPFDPSYLSPKIELNIDLFRGRNLSYLRFRLLLKNVGKSPIENPQIRIELVGDFADLQNENFDTIFTTQEINSDVSVIQSLGIIQITPHRNVLAPNEKYFTNDICIKPNLKGSDIILKWDFISNEYKKRGELELKIGVKLIRKDSRKTVDAEEYVRVVHNIEDYYEN